jgi:hypothetical protein
MSSVSLPSRPARRDCFGECTAVAHRGNRTAVGVAIQRHLDRRAQFAEHRARIEIERYEARRPVPDNPCTDRFRGWHAPIVWRPGSAVKND